MKTLPLLLLAAFVGAVSGGLSTTLFSSSESAAARGQEIVSLREESPASPQANSEDVREQLHRLEQENDDLRQRVVLLEERADSIREPLTTASMSSESLEAEVRARMNSIVASGAEAPEFTGSVEQALLAIRKREKAEQERAAEARRIERTEARLEKMATRLELNAHQVGDLRALWIREEDAKKHLLEIKQEGGRERFREAKRDFDEDYRASLARILTPEQLETYTRAEDRRKRKADETSRKKVPSQSAQDRASGNKRRERK